MKNEIEDVFSAIYKTEKWKSGLSVSGSGSELNQTADLIIYLQKFIQKNDVKSLLDIPCGDLNWIQYLLAMFPDLKYIGGDVVKELIDINRLNFPPFEFQQLDIVNDELPKADLLLVRDCLVHLTNEMVTTALKNIAGSEIKFIALTTFTKRVNVNINLGEWRPINLCAAPFLLPHPWQIINENCPEANGAYLDKSIGIWKIEQLLSNK